MRSAGAASAQKVEDQVLGGSLRVGCVGGCGVFFWRGTVTNAVSLGAQLVSCVVNYIPAFYIFLFEKKIC